MAPSWMGPTRLSMGQRHCCDVWYFDRPGFNHLLHLVFRQMFSKRTRTRSLPMQWMLLELHSMLSFHIYLHLLPFVFQPQPRQPSPKQLQHYDRPIPITELCHRPPSNRYIQFLQFPFLVLAIVLFPQRQQRHSEQTIMHPVGLPPFNPTLCTLWYVVHDCCGHLPLFQFTRIDGGLG